MILANQISQLAADEREANRVAQGQINQHNRDIAAHNRRLLNPDITPGQNRPPRRTKAVYP